MYNANEDNYPGNGNGFFEFQIIYTAAAAAAIN